MSATRPLTVAMVATLGALGAGRGVAVDQIAGTIGATARTEYKVQAAGTARLNGATVKALIVRGLVVLTGTRTTGAWQISDVRLTDAGWRALADAFGVQVRPEQDTPDLPAAVLTRDDTAALAVIADGGVMNFGTHGITTATMDRLYRRGLIHTVCGVFRITPAGDRALAADASIPVRPAVRPQVRLWYAIDLDPRTAAPWIDHRGTVNIPCGSWVAQAVGLGGSLLAAGKNRRRCAMRNVPAILRPLVEVAIRDHVTSPDTHPMRDDRLVR